MYQKILENISLEDFITTQFDDMGEALHGSVVDQLKEPCGEIFSKIKEGDQPPPKRDEIWKK